MTTAFWTGFTVGYVVCCVIWIAGIMWFGGQWGRGG
jgi:hypothetical protein